MRVFVAGYDVMGKNMAGPGMRSFAIARFLSNHADVTLSCDESSGIESLSDKLNCVQDSDVLWDSTDYWSKYDVAIMAASQNLKVNLPDKFPVPLIVDIYDPYILENLELHSALKPSIRDYEYLRHLKALLEMLLMGDCFIVTNGRTRDFFTGMMASWGIINPITASGNKVNEYFLNIPFGIPDEPFNTVSEFSVGEIPDQIIESDYLILWAGGLWDWLDPLSLIESMPLIQKSCPNAKLLFMGYKHPNRHVPVMDMAMKCIDKAKKLKIYNSSVIFRDWTPFEERIPLLKRANLGVSLHKDHLETRYSFRTRLMDYIWAGIPMVISGGDFLSEELSKSGVAKIVPENDVDLIADIISGVLRESKPGSIDEKTEQGFESLRHQYRWDTVLTPLSERLKNIQKIDKDNYGIKFKELLMNFPVPRPPGIIEKGMEKIKKGLR